MKLQTNLLLLILLGSSMLHLASAQTINPVKWKTEVKKIKKNEYLLTALASIDRGWHLYSQKVPKGGPIATNFEFQDKSNYELLEATEESKGITVLDPVFKMRIKYFDRKATFKQRITVYGDVSQIKASVRYMACDNRRCLPPKEKELNFILSEK